MDTNNYLELHKKLWDDKTDVHVRSDFYQVEQFKRGACSLNAIEVEGLGPVEGRSLLHLQCHFGLDTLSWARRGARVCGVDLSGKSIAQARRLAEELRLEASFIEADVLQLGDVLEEKFDIVFTSYGSLCWLPDLQAWAYTVANNLKNGGIFYMAEFHPALYMLDWDTLTPAFDYFDKEGGYLEDTAGTYTDPDAAIGGQSYYFPHSLSDIIRALTDRGLRLLDFREFDYSPYNCFPKLEARAMGEYVFSGMPIRFPYVFSLKMKA